MLSFFSQIADTGSLKQEAFWSIGIKIVYTLLTPVTVILLARLLGPEQFGIYAFTISVVILLSVPANLGFPLLIVRYAANYHYRQQWNYLKGLFRFTNGAVLFASLILIAIALLLLLADTGRLEPQNRSALVIALPLVMILSLEVLRAASLRGLNRVISGQLPEMLFRPALFLMFIGIGYLTLSPMDAIDGVLLYLAAATLSYLSGALILFLLLPEPFRKAKPDYDIRPWIKSALPLLILGSVQVLGGQIDVIFLGLFRTNAEAGVYKAVFQTAILVTFGFSAINSIIAPKLSNLYLDRNWKQLKRMIIRSNWSVFLLGLPPALLFLLFGEFLLGLVFGSEFAVGFLALVILVAGRLVNALFGTSSTVLKMTGHEKMAAIGITTGILVNVLLNVLLIPPYGIEGAAVASSTGLITWNTILILSVKNRLGINPLYTRQ